MHKARVCFPVPQISRMCAWSNPVSLRASCQVTFQARSGKKTWGESWLKGWTKFSPWNPDAGRRE